MSIFMSLKNCKKSILDKVCENAIKSPEIKEQYIILLGLKDRNIFLLNLNVIKWRLLRLRFAVTYMGR